jgi:hypothetical protein
VHIEVRSQSDRRIRQDVPVVFLVRLVRTYIGNSVRLKIRYVSTDSDNDISSARSYSLL